LVFLLFNFDKPSKVPGIRSVTVVLLAGLQVGQVLLTFLRLPPDAPVQDAHDRHRSIKGGDGRAKSDVIVCLDELDEAFICCLGERANNHQ
jgi:hypothetical protein